MIPVAGPSFDEREERLVAEALRSGWVAQGPRVAEFERLVADAVGAREAVAVSSCTAALFLCLHTLGIGPGDEVIVPSLSFIASANPIVHAGATPVFVDVEPRSYNVDPAAVEAARTPRTRAVIAVHQLGLPADLERLGEIAGRHGLCLLEDAACALGSRAQGRAIGGAGNLACFSFHARKVVVTGEGGMITTDDADLAARLRRLRHQGMSVSDVERHRSERVIVESYGEIGFNFRMSDIHAAIGVAQMAKLEQLLASRRAIATRYDAELKDLPGVQLPFAPDGVEPNHQSYIVRLRGAARSTRDAVMDELQRRGVATRRGLMASHLEPCHAGARHGGSLRESVAASEQTLLLPIFAHLEARDQGIVIEQFRAVVSGLAG